MPFAELWGHDQLTAAAGLHPAEANFEAEHLLSRSQLEAYSVREPGAIGLFAGLIVGSHEAGDDFVARRGGPPRALFEVDDDELLGGRTAGRSNVWLWELFRPGFADLVGGGALRLRPAFGFAGRCGRCGRRGLGCLPGRTAGLLR